MTPNEANTLRYLAQGGYRSTHEVSRHFRWDLPAAELCLRALLAHSFVEEDAKRYYRITRIGEDAVADFEGHWKVKPFSEGRRPV